MLDALVIGKGPAGLAAAAALAEEGLSVAVAGPRDAPWTAVYGAWMDDLEEVGCPAFVQNRWTRVTLDAGRGPRDLGRTYARIDNAGLAAALRARIEGRGGAWIDGVAEKAEHRREGSAVAFEDGRVVEARVVVEATGHRTRFVERARHPEPAYQTAVGWTLETEAHPYAPDQAVLMDWSDAHLSREERRGPPTFLYAFPLGGGRLFVEETALAARPQAEAGSLRRRLERRLEHLGIAGERVGGEERVWIPMGGAIPRPQRVIGFGAAAGMVHPATGYSVARALRAAPALGRAVAEALRAGAGPEGAARAGWEAVWPADRRRSQALYRFGMEMLLKMDAATTRAFFASFFELPPEDWRAYLSDLLTTAELTSMMARFFTAAPADVRRVLMWGSMSAAGRELAAGMMG